MIAKYDQAQPDTRLNAEWYKTLDSVLKCPHVYEVRKQIQKNGAVVFRDQCTRCGNVGDAVPKTTLTERQIAAAPMIDEALRSKGYEDRNHRQTTIVETEQRKRDALWWAWYNRYLSTPIWQQKRRLVLLRAQGICESCRSEPATEVHHLTYVRVGMEPLFDLVAVCKSCHEGLDGKTP